MIELFNLVFLWHIGRKESASVRPRVLSAGTCYSKGTAALTSDRKESAEQCSRRCREKIPGSCCKVL